MEEGFTSSLFVNDGSFMQKFRQLQKEKEKDVALEESKSSTNALETSMTTGKIILDSTANDKRKVAPAASSGKLAFSLKQKSKLAVAPVKFGVDDDDEEQDAGNISGDSSSKRQRLGEDDAYEPSPNQWNVAPSSPSDPAVKKVADKLASFVAKHGRQFEHITRQRNPGDTPFKFLFDEDCQEYKYYEYRLVEEEKALELGRDSQTAQSVSRSTAALKTSGGSQRPTQQHMNYQIPASALYEADDGTGSSITQSASARGNLHGESDAPSAADPVAMMEFYVKKAAQEERRRQPKQSKDEMPPPASLQGPGKRGHHMGDYIPPEELEKFLSTCSDVVVQKAAGEAADKAKIQANNVGHRLLSKMGWKEGEGLGSSKSGRADPIMAGNVKSNNLGVGAAHPGEVNPDDDIYEQYKKRMMLGYRYRPNPLNNPRKAYY